MIIPQKTSRGYTILQTLYKHGPMTYKESVDKHGDLGICHSKLKTQYNNLIHNRSVELVGEVYFLSRSMEKYLGDIDRAENGTGVPLVPPRTPPEFRPIQSKYLPSLEPRRSDTELRAEHAIYCSGTSPEPFRGVEKG